MTDRVKDGVKDRVKDSAITIAVSLIKHFEGLHLSPYLCPAGIPTIGYGATFYEDGTRVSLLDAKITAERAEALLLWMIRTQYLPSVQRLCPGIDNPSRLAALIDFTFNLGSGALRSSTLRRKINQGQWGDVPYELRKWVKGGGRTLSGLVKRRNAEAKLILVGPK